MGPRLRSLNTPERRGWWVSFAILFVLGALWALANPPTAASDEPAHVVHAAAVANGDLFGSGLITRAQLAQFPTRWGFGSDEAGDPLVYRRVTVPEIYDRPNWGCYVNVTRQPITCLDFTGPQRERSVISHTTRYPPAYPAFVGIPAKLVSAGPRAVYVMRLSGVVLAAALMASAVSSIRRLGRSPFGMLGLLVAVTPTVLFYAATVNPSGPEIAAAIALWASGAVLVAEARASARGPLDGRLIARVGIAAAVLVLARQLGPFWVGLIVAVLAFLAGRQGLRALGKSRVLWLAGALVGVGVAAQVAWIVWLDALDPHNFIGEATHQDAIELARKGIGDSYFYLKEMIGVFGWRDVPAPTLTFLVWICIAGALSALAIAVGYRRDAIAMVVVGALTAILPVAFLVQQSGYAGWQGRYTMPLAVGVPVLAGLALRGIAVRSTHRFVIVLAGAALGAGHVLAFGENLRRYTVGTSGTVWFWTREAWSPPVSSLLLLVAFVVATAGWVTWLLFPSGAHRRVEQRETEAVPFGLAEAGARP